MRQLNLDNRVAIVTGAGRGMGRSHALMLAARGARVVVNDIKPAGAAEGPADQVVSEIRAAGGTAVSNHDSVVDSAESLIQRTLAEFGQIDIVINNAGVLSSVVFEDADPRDWWAVFDVHFRGTVEVCRAAWPHLRRSEAARIINTASSGMLGNPGLTSYGAAKGAIFAFSRSLAMEAAPAGILVNCIFPSAWTRMTQEINDPGVSTTLQKYFQPEHVSALVVWLSHQDTHVHNQAFQVSGGRAGRISMGMMPTVRVSESVPEQWAQHDAALLEDGTLIALASTAEMFGNELADADPGSAHAKGNATGGLMINAVTGRS